MTGDQDSHEQYLIPHAMAIDLPDYTINRDRSLLRKMTVGIALAGAAAVATARGAHADTGQADTPTDSVNSDANQFVLPIPTRGSLATVSQPATSGTGLEHLSAPDRPVLSPTITVTPALEKTSTTTSDTSSSDYGTIDLSSASQQSVDVPAVPIAVVDAPTITTVSKIKPSVIDTATTDSFLQDIQVAPARKPNTVPVVSSKANPATVSAEVQTVTSQFATTIDGVGATAAPTVQSPDTQTNQPTTSPAPAIPSPNSQPAPSQGFASTVDNPSTTPDVPSINPNSSKESPTIVGETFGSPLDGKLVMTSPFGHRAKPTPGASSDHKGDDLKASTGDTIKAAQDGVVVFAGEQSGYGNIEIIDHGTDGNGADIRTAYAHESKLIAKVGDHVKEGQKIGEVGMTGGVSTGPHLHFEIRVNGQQVDPAPYLFHGQKTAGAHPTANSAAAQPPAVPVAPQITANTAPQITQPTTPASTPDTPAPLALSQPDTATESNSISIPVAKQDTTASTATDAPSVESFTQPIAANKNTDTIVKNSDNKASDSFAQPLSTDNSSITGTGDTTQTNDVNAANGSTIDTTPPKATDIPMIQPIPSPAPTASVPTPSPAPSGAPSIQAAPTPANPETTQPHDLTSDMIKKMFDPSAAANIDTYWPQILAELRNQGMGDRMMQIYANATIRAEAGSYAPEHEVGNSDKYAGRGIVQVTGFENYKIYGGLIHVDLVDHPELANDPHNSVLILVDYLKRHEGGIRAALSKGDLKEARKLVNGGYNGLKTFTIAFNQGLNMTK